MSKYYKTKENVVFDTIVNLVMIFTLLVCFLPFVYMAALSFSSSKAIINNQVLFWPVGFNLDAYKQIFTYPNFFQAYGNTFIYTIGGTTIAMLMTIMFAYPLSKDNLMGHKVFMKIVVISMFFAGGMIPNYILMVSLGLRDTVASFILPGIISTYYVILMRSFFLTLPRELEEAGEIDGLDLWGVFWRIAIPLSKPIIATMTLFYVVQYWNDWFDAFLYLDTTTKWPVAYYLRQLISSASGTSADAGDAMQIASNIKSCAMVLTSAPIICIYPFIQKYFVQGMMLGGVKG